MRNKWFKKDKKQNMRKLSIEIFQEGKLKKTTNLWKDVCLTLWKFTTEKLSIIVKLVHIEGFEHKLMSMLTQKYKVTLEWSSKGQLEDNIAPTNSKLTNLITLIFKTKKNSQEEISPEERNDNLKLIETSLFFRIWTKRRSKSMLRLNKGSQD